MIIQLIGLIAGFIGISTSLPQMIKIKKLGHSHGVSLMTYVINYASGRAWFGYGLRTHSIAQLIVAPLSMILTGIVIYEILGTKIKTYLILTFPPIIFMFMIWHLPLLLISGILLCFGYNRIPQTYDSWMNWNSSDPTESAVSVPSWTLNSIASILWIVYGVLGSYPMSTITSSIAMVFNSLILFFELKANRRVESSIKKI